MAGDLTLNSAPVSVFHDRRLPEKAAPAGYAALIDAHDLAAPLPRRLAAISTRHRVYEKDGWRIFTPRHQPDPTLESHLTFALRYEGLDLAVLKRLFAATGPDPIEAMVRAAPTGKYAKRLWFLYEWLTGATLNLPDAEQGAYTLIVDPKMQYCVPGKTSPRHRVRNNLPGVPGFCPMIERTKALDAFVAMNLAERAREIVAQTPKDLLARTAAFLLLKDSKSSYAIEGERPAHNRIQRWGRATCDAGRHALDEEELLRLQRMVIEDDRFVKLGWRDEGGFVGEHERETGLPLPVHISARHRDLEQLIDGLIQYGNGAATELDPVLAAAALSFGFTYIHPFADGNGRLHRYLIHHILSMRGFNPPGVVFPVSAAILDRIGEYKSVLESYSTRLLPLIEWRPTPRNNIEILNDTGDFYRYFDATVHAEFLFSCVAQTIETDLPNEAAYLQRYDQFSERVQAIIDMPAPTLDLLLRFLNQNDGQFSKRARDSEFSALTDQETETIEEIYGQIF